MTPKKRICKYFGTPIGCPHGSRCRFTHTGPEPGRPIMDNLGEPLTSIDLAPNPSQPPPLGLPGGKSYDRRDIASFSWTTGDYEIAVPGLPPKLTPPELPLRLRRDRDVYGHGSSEKHKAPHPYAFEPLMLAVITMSPGTNFEDINMISGLNTLRKLFSIVHDDLASTSSQDEARVDLEIVGSTVFLKRWHRLQSSATQMTLTGCGRGFEEACTTVVPGFEDCTSYHRVSAMRMASLSLLVQQEADCFVDTAELSYTTMCAQEGSRMESKNPPQKVSTLRVSSKGLPLGMDKIAEIKSRSIKSDLGPDVWTHLWLSGVYNLFLGKHYCGGFSEHNVRLSDESRALLEWEEKRNEKIEQFKRLLQEIYHRSLAIGLGKGRGNNLFSLVHRGGERRLTLHARAEDDRVLPEHMEGLFERHPS